jgi:hypothetical protein
VAQHHRNKWHNYTEISSETKEQLYTVITENNMAADTINEQLSTLVDLGNTEELLGTVYYSAPEEAGQLYNELLSGSPYLSDTVVLQAVIKEEVLNNAMIRDIMVANPHTAKSEVILTGLDNRSLPLPDNMYNEIVAGADTVSSKELIEASLSTKLSNRDQAFYALSILYLEENFPVLDSLIAMTDGIALLQAKYMKSLYLLDEEETDLAYYSAVDIPSLVPVTGKEAEYGDFVAYMQSIQQYGSSDSIPLLNLETYCLSSNEQIKAFSRNTLIDMVLTNYQEPYLFPETTKSTRVRHNMLNNVQGLLDKTFLRVFPNPATDFITIDYRLQDEETIGFLKVFDLSGKTHNVKLLSVNTNQLIISIKGLTSGIYLMELSDLNGRIDVVKFTIK